MSDVAKLPGKQATNRSDGFAAIGEETEREAEEREWMGDETMSFLLI